MLRSLRQAARALRKNVGFTLAAVCSLAIGIGANSAMFSSADALVLRPLPVLEPSRVVNLISSSPTSRIENVSYPDYKDFRDRNRSFDGVVAYSLAPFGLSREKDQTPETRYGFFVSGIFSKSWACNLPSAEDSARTKIKLPTVMLLLCSATTHGRANSGQILLLSDEQFA